MTKTGHSRLFSNPGEATNLAAKVTRAGSRKQEAVISGPSLPLIQNFFKPQIFTDETRMEIERFLSVFHLCSSVAY
jgi:hypothetical protein